MAKAFEAETPVTDISQSPTLTEEMTRAGVILGTAAYMSPEQAKGEPVDKRADIFAFGCVLYELLTGKRTFDGKTITETLAKILEGEPNWAALPDTTPLRIKELLQDCLQKEVHNRVHDVSQLRIQIKKALNEPTSASSIGVASTTQPALWRRAIPWSITAAVMVIAGWALWSLTVPTSKPLTRMVITTPDNAPLVGTLAISPDGRKIVYQGASQLYLRQLDDPGVTPLSGTEGANGSTFLLPGWRVCGVFTQHRRAQKGFPEGRSGNNTDEQLAGSWPHWELGA